MMVGSIAETMVMRALAWANAKAQSRTPLATKLVRVVVTGAGEPQAEEVEADTPAQAAERACANVAKRRLKDTAERSWRLVAIVHETRFEVDVSCYLKAEVCGGNS